MPTALITGVAGQDGSYLAELLLERGYRVIGTVRADLQSCCDRIKHFRDDIEVVEGGLLDEASLRGLLERSCADEIYNCAARASSSQLFDDPVATGEINGLSVGRLLESIRQVNKTIRFCQASSSEMFGKAKESPQRETTAFYPRNPYGVAKVFAHWLTVNYRETQGIFACSSILFNHESPRRGQEFVTRQITQAVARIKLGQQTVLRLGNLEARRDWGYAPDYVRAMWQMLQIPMADDYIVATGETHSVREFCEIAFRYVALNYEDHVVQDGMDRRPPDSIELRGDPEKIRRVLGWRPSVSFEELVCLMVDADLRKLTVHG